MRQLPSTLHLCLEEAEWSRWLCEILSPQVAEIVVVWPERRGAAKTDSQDARELAERPHAGRSGAFVSTPEIE